MSARHDFAPGRGLAVACILGMPGIGGAAAALLLGLGWPLAVALYLGLPALGVVGLLTSDETDAPSPRGSDVRRARPRPA